MSYTKQQIEDAIKAVEENMPIATSELNGCGNVTLFPGSALPWEKNAKQYKGLAQAIGFQTKEEALKKIEEFEHLADELRKDWGIVEEPAKESILNDPKGEIHNPRGVDSDKLPEGRRFMWKSEVGTGRPQREEIWKWEGFWNKTTWKGDGQYYTYCVPIDFKD